MLARIIWKSFNFILFKFKKTSQHFRNSGCIPKRSFVRRWKMLTYWSIMSLCFCLSIDSADDKTERCAAEDPGQNQEDSRHQIFSRTQKSELKMFNIWWIMNEWGIYIALYCVLLYTQSALQSYEGVSPQPPPVCSIHLDDATAATAQRRQCAHHTPATGGEERES